MGIAAPSDGNTPDIVDDVIAAIALAAVAALKKQNVDIKTQISNWNGTNYQTQLTLQLQFYFLFRSILVEFPNVTLSLLYDCSTLCLCRSDILSTDMWTKVSKMKYQNQQNGNRKTGPWFYLRYSFQLIWLVPRTLLRNIVVIIVPTIGWLVLCPFSCWHRSIRHHTINTRETGWRHTELHSHSRIHWWWNWCHSWNPDGRNVHVAMFFFFGWKKNDLKICETIIACQSRYTPLRTSVKT